MWDPLVADGRTQTQKTQHRLRLLCLLTCPSLAHRDQPPGPARNAHGRAIHRLRTHAPATEVCRCCSAALVRAPAAVTRRAEPWPCPAKQGCEIPRHVAVRTPTASRLVTPTRSAALVAAAAAIPAHAASTVATGNALTSGCRYRVKSGVGGWVGGRRRAGQRTHRWVVRVCEGAVVRVP